MIASNYLLAVLATSGFVAAQSTLCSQATVTITSPADATALAGCTSVQNIVISPLSSGAITIPNGVLSMASLQAASATMLTSLSAPSVAFITGMFNLTGLTILSSLSFPELAAVGSINWVTLPALQSLSLFTKTITQASDVSIYDTSLSSLQGINLMSANSFAVAQNSQLNSISSQLSKVTGNIVINANAPGLTLSMPNLTSAGSLAIQNVTSFDIPKLGSVGMSFVLQFSDLTTFSAPNLTTIGGDLYITNNTALTNISCPELTTLGASLTLQTNPNLLNINGFPILGQTGAINFAGNFTNAVLPSLSNVAGTFNAQSSGNFSCAPFQALFNNHTIHGQYHCTSSSGNVGTSVNTGDTTGTATAVATTTGHGAAGALRPVDMLPMMGMTALIGGLIMAGGVFRLSL